MYENGINEISLLVNNQYEPTILQPSCEQIDKEINQYQKSENALERLQLAYNIGLGFLDIDSSLAYTWLEKSAQQANNLWNRVIEAHSLIGQVTILFEKKTENSEIQAESLIDTARGLIDELPFWNIRARAIILKGMAFAHKENFINANNCFHEAKKLLDLHKVNEPYTMLSAMENAGKADFDEATERKGLGTPATRASVIEHLISCGYVERKGRKLLATQDGMDLISVMPDYIKSPDLTAEWENKLLQVEKGNIETEAFMTEIRALVSQILMDYRNVSDVDRLCLKHFEEIGTCPICGKPVLIGSKSYFCSGQDCRFVIWKDLSFLRSMKKQVDDNMAAQLLANGEVKVDNLYSAKKDKYFSAKLVMEIIDDKPEYSLEFPGREKKGKKKMK